MENTEIPAERTAGQIQDLLGRGGAKAVVIGYEGGTIDSVAFQLEAPGGKGGTIQFKLPCRWRAVYKLIYGRDPRAYAEHDRDVQKARRVAWRQVFRWVEAQLAMTRTGMTRLEEVFLPYMTEPGGQTLFEVMQDKGFMLEYKR